VIEKLSSTTAQVSSSPGILREILSRDVGVPLKFLRFGYRVLGKSGTGFIRT